MDVGQQAQEDIVVVRTGVVECLVAPGRGAAGYLAGQGVDDALYGVLVQAGNHAAVLVGLEVLEGDLVAVLVDAVAAVDDGAVGLLLGPGGVCVVVVH